VSDGYRMVPGSQLVLYAASPNGLGELILTNKSEEQLVSKLLWGFVGGAIAAGLGAAAMVSGAIMEAMGIN